jgi:tRNA nucleotidyltransferase/poly(A) polymerase|tara:strand:+ start:2029 stop:2157 length:129 start_codon:yes stop_codon:yes gene_type:complete
MANREQFEYNRKSKKELKQILQTDRIQRIYEEMNQAGILNNK